MNPGKMEHVPFLKQHEFVTGNFLTQMDENTGSSRDTFEKYVKSWNYILI